MSVPREALVGADLGGTNFRVGVRLRDEVRLLDQESCPADPGWDAAAVLDRMEQMLALILARRGGGVRVAAVGFGATGDIDFRAGICYSMKRFPGLEEAPLRGLLQERFGCPAAILNDGLCAALGELRAGAGRGVDDFVMVTL